jgi:integrase
MPRKVRDSNLETRSARAKLKPQHKPFYRLIEPGLHLGYRRLPNAPGTWVVRRYVGGGKYRLENLRTADGVTIIADDYGDADGERVLTFAQAQDKARSRPASRSTYTVSDALNDYLKMLVGEGRSERAILDARWRLDIITRALGDVKISTLSAERLRAWLIHGVKTGGDQEKQRASRATANRNLTALKAALNHAFRSGKIETDTAWRRLKAFQHVGVARSRYLTVAEAKRLVNACDPDFRSLVQAALQTGARYGELCRLEVRDFSGDAGALHIRQSKTGRQRHIILTAEGIALFQQLIAGKSGDDLILTHSGGGLWGKGHQHRPMQEAVVHARISPPISFHGLRHTWASLAVMAGMPLMVVARNLGHSSTTMVEKHYGHLSASYVTDSIRKHAPSFGFVPDKKVVWWE